MLYFCYKDKFVDDYEIWLPKLENKSNYTIKALCANGREKFISIKLINFCEIRGITHCKYVVPYMHKDISLAEKKW